jgi:acetyl-CoA acetyltransferase
MVDTGNNTYGGKYVINPSGGLISKGPLSAPLLTPKILGGGGT